MDGALDKKDEELASLIQSGRVEFFSVLMGRYESKILRYAKKFLYNHEAKYKEPIVLYYLEELSYKEIAEVMHIPVSTVGIRIKRAKKMMKIIFEKQGYNHG